MKVTWIPATVLGSGPEHFQFSSSAVINDTLAVDAGSIGYYGSAQEQSRVKHILITHTHIDHVATLPIFVENAYMGGPDCVTIYGSEAVLHSCQVDLFNDRLWPDFIKMSENNDNPFLKLEQFDPGQTREIEGLKITAVSVDHVVPTQGYVIEDKDSAVIITSDTGPTDEIWRVAEKTPNLKAIFLEATFPNNMEWLAEVSKHLTPAMFATETKKLSKSVRWLVVHIKARFQDQVRKELSELDVPGLELTQFGVPYTF